MYKTLFFCITSLLLFTCKKEVSKEKTATKKRMLQTEKEQQDDISLIEQSVK